MVESSQSDAIGEHDDVTGIAGLNPFWVCSTCKLSAIKPERLSEYPCEPDKYDPDFGEGQPEPLREEQLAYDILKLGSEEEVDVPSTRGELPSEAQQWLEKVEEYSEFIDSQQEEEKLRIAAEWTLIPEEKSENE